MLFILLLTISLFLFVLWQKELHVSMASQQQSSHEVKFILLFIALTIWLCTARNVNSGIDSKNGTIKTQKPTVCYITATFILNLTEIFFQNFANIFGVLRNAVAIQ